MKRFAAALVAALLVAGSACAQPRAAQQGANPSDEQLLALYEGLRVADVADGMDAVGLRNVGLMDTRIQPLWRDTGDMGHIMRGIALTVRYVPHNQIVPNPIPQGQFPAWEGRWYNEISPEPFMPLIKPGHVIVIDASGNGDTGSIGSFNSLAWTQAGAVGVVTTGSARDTDEIIKQRIPLYMDPLQRGRGIRPGRNMVESVNEPVEIAGAYVRPGDVIVADGDGVVVVPREHAVPVAEIAHGVLASDMAGRRNLYQQLGRPLDDTVQ